MPKQKHYVVWKGKQPGVFSSWKDCEQQIKGFEGALYKSFETIGEAEKAFTEAPHLHLSKPKKCIPKTADISKNIITPSISVDAACSGNPGIMEYQGVDTATKERIFHKGPFPDATNNIGEFLALVHALSLLKKNNIHDMPVYSDSITAIAWVRNKKAKTKLEGTDNNNEIFELIKRAEYWLNTNTYSNPIIKWETEKWGEIPADFGRK